LKQQTYRKTLFAQKKGSTAQKIKKGQPVRADPIPTRKNAHGIITGRLPNVGLKNNKG
jgi:hypothetical protein